MVKASAVDLPHVIEKFEGTFESLWNDDEFERYDPDSSTCVGRLRDALGAERSSSRGAILSLLTPRPYPFQAEILDQLEAERSLRGHMRNLVVAATGTGKTVIAAFDYQRQAAKLGVRPRLLFVAHRKEILEQAQATFRQVLREPAFGELFVDGREPQRWEHVFASVQSASRGLAARVSADHFAHVVIDECHHLPADSYHTLAAYLRPAILVGLTATPERSDGRSLLPDFDGRIAAELRLWHALERQLLVPFEYYGIADHTDLTAVRWSRQGYSVDELSKLYTGNDARVDLIAAELAKRVVDVRAVRALAFCVSIEHAEFMARSFCARGIPAAAVHGQTADEERASVRRRLELGEICVVCACDLYNEGIDLPFVDTLLLLRPTQSATLFLQQLGRGLRIHGEQVELPRARFHRAAPRGIPLRVALCGDDWDPAGAPPPSGGSRLSLPRAAPCSSSTPSCGSALHALKRALATAADRWPAIYASWMR
ncbi:MAG: DEAD/DEAH box helicase family protein [bacterium]